MTNQSIFESIRQICPIAPAGTSDIITVIVANHNIGKEFSIGEGGKVNKKSVVNISKASACQFYVPDHATLERLLSVVSNSPNAAVTNCGWRPVGLGVSFNFTTTAYLQKKGRERDAIFKESSGTLTFARIKDHAFPSSWQVLDRDDDMHTPEWAKNLDFNKWVKEMDKVLPGLATTRMLRAHSSSARVLDGDGKAFGGGNGHTWIKIADANDADRCRAAIITRALALNLAWIKPKLSKKTGDEIAGSVTTIVDTSVWSAGRIVFEGKPTAKIPLSVASQSFSHIDGDNEVLDTSSAVISGLGAYRGAKKIGLDFRIKSTTDFSFISDTLLMDTELELKDGGIVSVRDAIKMVAEAGKLRCQAPFRESSSMAAFINLDRFGNPFVWDSGIDTKYVLASAKANTDQDFISFIGKLKVQLNAIIGKENTEAILDIDALQYAWGRSFMVSTNNKIGMLNAKDDCIELLERDAESHGFRDVFGHFFLQQMLSEVLSELTAGLNPKDTKVLLDGVRNLETKPLLRMLKTRKQAKQVKLSVDMFAKYGSTSVSDGIARINLPHRPFVVQDRPSASVITEVVNDYYDHFPEFGPFLEMLLHARFSTDRRRAFVWLHAGSDFGKGFMTSVFAELGLLFEISREGIEKVISGATVGLSPTEIFRCWILHVDEFKAASRELKQLNSSMQVSAKYDLQTQVNLYVKLFCSAEDVRSLTGGGIEAQFNNRFSYINPAPATLDSRPLFSKIGKQQYLLAMAAHVADYLNAGVGRLAELGKVESSRVAEPKVDEYQAARRLDKTFGSMDADIYYIAKKIRELLRQYAKAGIEIGYSLANLLGVHQNLLLVITKNSTVGWIEIKGTPQHVIRMSKTTEFVAAYIKQPGADPSTAGKFAHKAKEIAAIANMLSDEKATRVYKEANLIGTPDRGRGLIVVIDASDDDLNETYKDDETESRMGEDNVLKEGISIEYDEPVSF